jgi:Spy/CpxP family protein refolding chaperone
MTLSRHASARTLVALFGLALAAASPSLAQGRGGPPGGGPGGPGGGGMGGPPMGGGGMGGPPIQNRGGMEPGMGNIPNQQPRPQNQPSDGRAGLQLGPPGRWWDDRGFAKNLKLRPEQQTRMDAIFEQNRGSLVTSFQNVQQAQAQMQELSKSATPDESALYAQIDRVAQARAELEKATTHYLLQLRKEMDADQIKRLEKASK